VIEVNKTIAIIVAATFVFAIASVSFAAGEKAEMAKPSENMPAEVTKTPAPTTEKMEKPGELNEQEEQEELKGLTPEEQNQLREQENQENQEDQEESE
jgi:hypothetical protein